VNPPPIPTDAPVKKPTSPAGQLGSVIGSVFGLAVGWYCGINLVLPLGAAFGLGWLLTKIPHSPTTFRLAWAVQAGHALWMMAGVALTGLWTQVAIDLVVLAVGLVWLWARPNLGAVIFLGLYQLSAGVVNVVALIHAQPGSVMHKALVAHVALRGAALALLVSGFMKASKEKSLMQTAPLSPTEQSSQL
jgi:hypothetical protein